MDARTLKWLAAVASGALVLATLEPLLRDPIDDGYPLSTYPMFASRRPTVLTVDYAYGTTKTNTRIPIAPIFVGSREVLQARAILERGTHLGPKVANELCAEIANRVVAAATDELAGITEIHLVSGTHDAVDYLVHAKPGREITRAICKLGGAP